MTLFEYLAAAHTLILTFAIARMLSGVPHALRPGRRYWVHVSWLSVAISFCLISFWGFWSYREFEWTFPLFLGRLAPTTLVYVFCSLVVPADASTVESWRDYFFSMRIPLLATGALFMGVVLFSNQSLLGVSVFHPTSLGPWTLLAICAIGLTSEKPRVHNILALGLPVLVVITILILARPDSLSSLGR